MEENKGVSVSVGESFRVVEVEVSLTSGTGESGDGVECRTGSVVNEGTPKNSIRSLDEGERGVSGRSCIVGLPGKFYLQGNVGRTSLRQWSRTHRRVRKDWVTKGRGAGERTRTARSSYGPDVETDRPYKDSG